MEEEPEDIYAAQREELMDLLRRLKTSGDSLVVHGEPRSTWEDAASVLKKLKRGYGFSRRESAALTEAGFDLPKLFPGL
jgi:hypothetical protein